MKAILGLALVAAIAAVKLEQKGIDYKELHEGPHWRKQWPVGAIDDSSEDAEVIDSFNEPERQRTAKQIPPP